MSANGPNTPSKVRVIGVDMAGNKLAPMIIEKGFQHGNLLRTARIFLCKSDVRMSPRHNLAVGMEVLHVLALKNKPFIRVPVKQNRQECVRGEGGGSTLIAAA